MDGWMGRWAGGCARHHRALICGLPLISLLVLIWIATCGGEWIHSCTQSTTSVIGCSVEWQPPYVPEPLCRGYNNKPLREVANKNNGDKSTLYHNLVPWKITLPTPTFFEHFCILPDYSVLFIILVLLLLLIVLLVHPNKRTVSSCQPSEDTSPSQGGVVEQHGAFICPPFPPSSHICSSLLSPPRQVSFSVACFSVRAANYKLQHEAAASTLI